MKALLSSCLTKLKVCTTGVVGNDLTVLVLTMCEDSAPNWCKSTSPLTLPSSIVKEVFRVGEAVMRSWATMGYSGSLGNTDWLVLVLLLTSSAMLGLEMSNDTRGCDLWTRILDLSFLCCANLSSTTPPSVPPGAA